MEFFCDENIPSAIARALNEIEKDRTDIVVHSTADLWGIGIKDPELIEKLKDAGGILITNDLRMKRNYCELLSQCKITAFFIVFPSGASFDFRVRQVFKIWEDIKITAATTKRPFLCKIHNNGRVNILR